MVGPRGNSDARRSNAKHLKEVSISCAVQVFWNPRTFHNVFHKGLVAEDFEDVLMGTGVHRAREVEGVRATPCTCSGHDIQVRDLLSPSGLMCVPMFAL